MNPGAMKLLGYSQKIYMTGRLAVADMPLTYRNFTDKFDWVMLDNAEMITASINDYASMQSDVGDAAEFVQQTKRNEVY